MRGDFNPLAGSSLWRGRFGGLWSIGLLVLLVGVLQFLLHGVAYGFPSFLLATAVLRRWARGVLAFMTGSRGSGPTMGKSDG